MTQKIVTPELVKKLRDQTGVGVVKCKEALELSQGDIEKAVLILRQAGMDSAGKKEGRETKEGAIATAKNDRVVVLVEVNAETDFVVQNNQFVEFARNLAVEIAETTPASLEAFSNQPYRKDPSLTIDQYRALVMQSLGEHIKIRRFYILCKPVDSSIGLYSHRGGRIVAVVVLKGSSTHVVLAQEIGMHVVAKSPEYLAADVVPDSVREAQLARDPEHSLDPFLDLVCLDRQPFVKDSGISVGQLVEAEGKKSGHELSIHSFIRWEVGG